MEAGHAQRNQLSAQQTIGNTVAPGPGMGLNQTGQSVPPQQGMQNPLARYQGQTLAPGQSLYPNQTMPPTYAAQPQKALVESSLQSWSV